MSAVSLPQALTCPTCGRGPVFGKCEPWNPANGPQAWYGICYSLSPVEHCVGVNGDDQYDVIEKWNAEVKR